METCTTLCSSVGPLSASMFSTNSSLRGWGALALYLQARKFGARMSVMCVHLCDFCSRRSFSRAMLRGLNPGAVLAHPHSLKGELVHHGKSCNPD
eukprot:1144446-Pelagomonas_calceolata.AAC.3